MCVGCGGKGYIETEVMRDAGAKPILKQCVVCRDTKAYQNRLQERLKASGIPSGDGQRIGVRGWIPRIIPGGKQ